MSAKPANLRGKVDQIQRRPFDQIRRDVGLQVGNSHCRQISKLFLCFAKIIVEGVSPLRRLKRLQKRQHSTAGIT
jgi:hypothetical protein